MSEHKLKTRKFNAMMLIMFKVSTFLRPPIEGVVIQTYGAGNMPCNRKDLLDVIKVATSAGIIIVNCTQCLRGAVNDLYETSKVCIRKSEKLFVN